MQRQIDKRGSENHNQQAGACCQPQRLHQCPRQAERIFGAKGLRRQSGGAHPQEKQQHEEKTGGRRADRDTAEVNRAVEMANHGGIHQSQQRNGDIGENHG